MAAPNLPNWTYQIKQISGVYALHGIDKQGHIVDSVGTDLDELEEDFFEAAQKIDRDHFSDVNAINQKKEISIWVSYKIKMQS